MDSLSKYLSTSLLLKSYAGQRVLVSGANGLLGSHIVKVLKDLGAEVGAMTLDLQPNSYYVKELLHNSTQNFTVDLRDARSIDRVLGTFSPDYVFHLGAVTQVETGFKDPRQTFETNVMGTVNLLESLRRIQISMKGIAIASSDKAYGYSKELPYKESFPLQAHGPYDTSKACTDLIAQSYSLTYNMPIVIVRAGNIYGPGDLNWSRIIPGTIRSLAEQKTLILRSDGTPIRDYIYVVDVAIGYLLANLHSQEQNGEAFNIASGNPYSVAEVVDMICTLMKKGNIVPQYIPSEYPEIQSQILDSTKANLKLDWRPLENFEENLKATINWYLEFLR